MKKSFIIFLCVLFTIVFSMTACREEDHLSSSRKKIRLLSIGNSYSQDALAYVPFIMQNMSLDVDMQIGILMQSSATAAMHVDNFTNQKASYKFNYYNGEGFWQVEYSKTIQWALDNYEWDIIIQQGSSKSVEFAVIESNNIQLNNLITTYVDKPVKFAWYQTIDGPAVANGNGTSINAGKNWSEEEQLSHYQNGVVLAQDMMNSGAFEYLIPVGTAIRNARTIPSLESMGDYSKHPNNTSGKGYLTAYDGVHLQEGLPCQIAAYAFVQVLLDVYGFKGYTVMGDSTRATAEWARNKSIPGPHGSYVGSTDENCRIAQECAIMAIKNPYEVTDMGYLINP